MKSPGFTILFKFVCLVLSLWSIGVFVCKSPSEIEKISPRDLPDSYYPLQVGNKWHYQRLESRSFTVLITAKENIDGKTYFIRSSSEDQFYETLREEDGLIYKRIEGKEYVYLDFNRSIGDKWQEFPYQRYAYIASRSDTISVRAGTFINCIRIVSESELDKTETWYAPGIGMVASDVEAKKDVIIIDGSCQLYSAVISGKSIP